MQGHSRLFTIQGVAVGERDLRVGAGVGVEVFEVLIADDRSMPAAP